jgi:hypothetical protein
MTAFWKHIFEETAFYVELKNGKFKQLDNNEPYTDEDGTVWVYNLQQNKWEKQSHE